MINKRLLYNKSKRVILKNLKNSLLKTAKNGDYSCEIKYCDEDGFQIIVKYLVSKNIKWEESHRGTIIARWGDEN